MFSSSGLGFSITTCYGKKNIFFLKRMILLKKGFENIIFEIFQVVFKNTKIL